jgi:hypothetical protein
MRVQEWMSCELPTARDCIQVTHISTIIGTSPSVKSAFDL